MSPSIAAFTLFLGTAVLILLSLKWDLRFGVAARLVLGSALGSLLFQLGLSRVVGNGILLVGLGIAFHVVIYLGIIFFLFYRDPMRLPPAHGQFIISPADGEVIYTRRLAPGAILQSNKYNRPIVLEELQGSDLSSKELWQVGISMKFTDVHVNRAPIAGHVAMVSHRPGRFLSLRRDDALNLNERQTILIEAPAITVGVVQIASRLVRRIESYVERLDHVDLGQRIGMIKFGSQVDLFFPTANASSLAVEPGRLVLAGKSVIAQLETASPATTSPS
jgi:phosphatidylserine decarboxylase